jgi:aspartyl aminopeptidase
VVETHINLKHLRAYLSAQKTKSIYDETAACMYGSIWIKLWFEVAA